MSHLLREIGRAWFVNLAKAADAIGDAVSDTLDLIADELDPSTPAPSRYEHVEAAG